MVWALESIITVTSTSSHLRNLPAFVVAPEEVDLPHLRNLPAFMVAPEQVDLVRVLQFQQDQHLDNLYTVVASIHVVAQKDVGLIQP
jgi:hypothetical protein